MRPPSSGRVGMTATALLLAGLLGSSYVVAQTTSGQTAQLDALVQAAGFSEAYAQGVLAVAQSSGLSVASEQALIVSGNSSLAAARAALGPGGDLGAGLVYVREAMGNFSAAAAVASQAVEAAGLAAPDVQAQGGEIAALSQAGGVLGSAVAQTCTNTSVRNATLVQAFDSACSTANSAFGNFTTALGKANATYVAVLAGSQGAGISLLATQVGVAATDLSAAGSDFALVSPFTYLSRGGAYVSGPLAQQYAAANASVKQQGILVGWLGSDIAGFQTLSTAQSQKTSLIATYGSGISLGAATVPMASVSSAASAQQAVLASGSSSLASFSSVAASLPIPGATIAVLQADITASQNSLGSYNSALSALSSSAGSLSATSISGFGSYVSAFNADSATAASSAASFSSTLSALQGEIGTLFGQYPLLSVLDTWQNTFAELSSSTSSRQASVASSAAAAYGSAQSLSAEISSLTAQVQSVSAVLVGPALSANVTAVTSAEAPLLNSTGNAAVASASSALTSDGQVASSFSIASQGLLGATLGAFSGPLQAVSNLATSLNAQSSGTSAAMAKASAYMISDLNARTNAVDSAVASISQANADFSAGQVAKGVSLLAKASVSFSLASSRT